MARGVLNIDTNSSVFGDNSTFEGRDKNVGLSDRPNLDDVLRKLSAENGHISVCLRRSRLAELLTHASHFSGVNKARAASINAAYPTR